MSDAIVKRILSNDNVFYRHQQNGESDLSDEDKETILRELLVSNKLLFVQRYGKYMTTDDCRVFEDDDDLTMKFMLNRIKDTKSRGRNVRNRRFIALQKMKTNGNFFSDEKMREREPYLYDVMVCRYLKEEDRINLRPVVTREEQSGWIGVLNQFESSSEVAQRRNQHQTQWERNGEESVEDEKRSRLMAHISNIMSNDEDIDNAEEDDKNVLEELKLEIDKIQDEDVLLGDSPDESPEMLRREFIAYMEERFLAGKDSRFFDYDTVDYDDTLDDIDAIHERDLEERWFEED